MFLAVSAHGENPLRVRLWQQTPSRLEITGEIQQIQGIESWQKPVAIPKSQTLKVEFKDQRWIVSGFKNQNLVFPRSRIYLKGRDLRINQKKVPEKIILDGHASSVDVVGWIPLEKYLVGVLAHEMPAHWPLESLKAQAVAARSYTLAVMNQRKNKTFQLESTVLDQVYAFLPEEELKSRFGRVIQAVEETKNEVLLSRHQQALKAYYHADCGGQTASAAEAWSTKEDLVSVQDASCPQNPQARWNLLLTPEQLGQRLQRWRPATAQVADLQLDGVSGRKRVRGIKVLWTSGVVSEISASVFREAMGFTELKSTQFHVKKSSQGWSFSGEGFGHGVGLCQWGSRHWGRQGWNYKKILSHYYPRARFSKAVLPTQDRPPAFLREL